MARRDAAANLEHDSDVIGYAPPPRHRERPELALVKSVVMQGYVDLGASRAGVRESARAWFDSASEQHWSFRWCLRVLGRETVPVVAAPTSRVVRRQTRGGATRVVPEYERPVRYSA